MTKDHVLLTIDSIENQEDNLIITLGNDSLSMRVFESTIFRDKDGVKFRANSLRPGQEIYVKLFDEENGVNPSMPTRTEIERLFLSRKRFSLLPNFILNN